MRTLSENPQKSLEALVPEVIAALVRPMTSRELAASLDLPSATIGNVLRLASNYGLTKKVSPFSERAQLWERAKADTCTTAWSAWENRPKSKRAKRSQSSSGPVSPPSRNLNTDFWSRWLRNDPSTRPQLDD